MLNNSNLYINLFQLNIYIYISRGCCHSCGMFLKSDGAILHFSELQKISCKRNKKGHLLNVI